MVQLFPSQQATKPWLGTGGSINVYNAPIRQWYFDKGFRKTPPRGVFNVVNYIKGRWTVY